MSKNREYSKREGGWEIVHSRLRVFVHDSLSERSRSDSGRTENRIDLHGFFALQIRAEARGIEDGLHF